MPSFHVTVKRLNILLPDCDLNYCSLNIYKMKKLVYTLVILLVLSTITYSQKAPIKFGNINKAELENLVFAPDTTAPAVILCDYGYFTESRFQFIRILRIKILKKEGYTWANQTFNTNDKTNIRGITFNLANNEIVESKLKGESIFKTKITENFYEMRVAMPNIKVGSIIDIEFTYSGMPYEWDFQQEIPVIHSELFLEPSPYVKFNKNYFGYIPLIESTNFHWIAKDVPAFKPEPYMTSSKNYRTRLEFDIDEVSFPGRTQIYTVNGVTYQRDFSGYYQGYTTSWDKIRDLLYFSKYSGTMGYLAFLYEHFGLSLANDTYLNETANTIKSQFQSQDELIKAAYDYTKQIKWNNSNRFLAEKSFLNNVYKEKKGNSADINLALVQLLIKLGLDAGPIVMSTRGNGRLSEIHPSINKLNYVIAAVFTDNDTILLDATEEKCPYYLLPMRALNGQSQFIDKKRTGWVQLTTDKKDKQMEVYSLSIGEDNSLKGKLNYSKGDYAALDFRTDYEDFNSDDEYLKDYKEGKKGLKIISHTIDNLDSIYKPINEEFEVEINNMISDIDGELYLTPLIYEQMKENPFKVNERNYPIDFGYTRDKTIIANYTFPVGYTVVSLPVNTNMKLPGNSAVFSCKSSVTEGKISIVYKFSINKSLFVQTEYADLREFYNQIIAKEAEPIVLKKNTN